MLVGVYTCVVEYCGINSGAMLNLGMAACLRRVAFVGEWQAAAGVFSNTVVLGRQQGGHYMQQSSF